MVLEMKVPSPGESITEVEIATWLVEDGDYVEKDQPIAEVDSDKATLELPAEESGIITLKAEEGDAVEVGAVVCLIDMDAAKPEGTEDSAPAKEETKAETPAATPAPAVEAPKATYASGTASPAAKKILAEKGIDASQVSGTGKDGRLSLMLFLFFPGESDLDLLRFRFLSLSDLLSLPFDCDFPRDC